MDSIGAEVGQKMRSAIKAKLMELDCYVDDELPDYIMVMVANKRTKSQMNEDLNLFLSSKTSTFVNWLHIVLKKLKEVTVTNPEVYKKVVKRKSAEMTPVDKSTLKIKKEKSQKQVKKESLVQKSDDDMVENKQDLSLTDNLPISANKLGEKRKIILTNDNIDGPSGENIAEDNFDIPLLSEVTETSNEQELRDIERKIRNVKSRLGMTVNSDDEENSSTLKVEENYRLDSENPEKSSSLANSQQIDAENKKDVAELDEFSIDANILRQNREILVEKDSGHEKTELVEKRPQHKRITFEGTEQSASSSRKVHDRWDGKPDNKFSDKSSIVKRPSILDRLGKRSGSPDKSPKKIKLSQYREEEDRFLGYNSEEKRKRSSSDRKSRLTSRLNRDRSRSRDKSPHRSNKKGKDYKNEGILSRLGVQSKVEVIIKKPEVRQSSDEEDDKVVREVPSLIKVKPRIIPSDVVQPNKNLLLKAVADAQRSIAQSPRVGKEVKPDGLYTKKYKEKLKGSPDERNKPSEPVQSRRLPVEEKNKLKDLIQLSSNKMRSRVQQSSDEYDSDGEYVPKPVKNVERLVPNYTPSTKPTNGLDNKQINTSVKENVKQQFIITLDGIDTIEEKVMKDKKIPVKLRLDDKKSPSPIIFDKTGSSNDSCTRPNIPDKLPLVHPPLSVKNKERCKYWPNCRQGDKCEFVHPSQSCEMFPMCKFGDKCLFLHPKCKFGSSCTKRDCPYDHNVLTSSKLAPTVPIQNCKFFPNCTNPSCPFYHPKPCKYGKYCKNIFDCTYSHNFVASKKNLSWKSK